MAELGPNTISAVVAVRNEEAVIERCLRSMLGVVAEIIVVHDGEPEDRTVEIAEQLGARVFVRPQSGIPEAHTAWAYGQARGQWLLNLDGDEFLSEELRAGLPALVARSDVDAYELLWKQWDGERYFTEDGPFKLVLLRRSATRMLGIPHAIEQVDGRIERSPLQLEHRPLYNNFSLAAMSRKWRHWSGIQANLYTSDFRAIEKFNWRGEERWPWKRRIANRLSPVLFLPYALATVAQNLWRERDYYTWRQNLRFATWQGLYAGLVQLQVAKRVYGRS